MKKLLCVCTFEFLTKHRLDLHRVDELKNFATKDEVLALVHHSCEEVVVYVHLWVL